MRNVSIELTHDQELGGYTASIPNLPAYGEGASKREAIEDLAVALRGYIETFGIDDAVARLPSYIATT